MRVLFTCVGGPGHLNPQLPISEAVQARGHNVRWVVPESLVNLVNKAGLAAQQLGRSREQRPSARSPIQPVSFDATRAEVRENFVRKSTRGQRFRRLGVFLDTWQPDVVVCDEFDFGAMLAAEQRAIPYAVVLVSASDDLTHPRVIGETLREIRAECGLPPDPELTMLRGAVRLSPFPPSLREPSTGEHTIRLPPAMAAPQPPDWVRAVPGAPTIYFTLGTEFGLESGDLYERVLAGVASGASEHPRDRR